PEGTASPDGTAPPNGPAEPRPLALEATTDEGEHTLETSVMIAPDHSLAMFTRACTRRNEDIASQLEVTAIDDVRPEGALPTQASITFRSLATSLDVDVDGELTEMRS